MSNGYGLRAAHNQQKQQRRKRLVFMFFSFFTAIAFSVTFYKLGVHRTELIHQTMLDEHKNSSELLADYKQKIDELSQKTELALAESKTWQERYEREVPTGAGKELYELLSQRLSEGIEADRLSFVIRNTQETSKCIDKPIIKKVPIGLEGSAELESIPFFDDTIFVQGEGKPAKNTTGSKESWFDSQNSVSVTLSHVTGKKHVATGKLPFQTILQVNDKAYHFHLRAGPKGYCFVSATLCDYP